MPQTDDNNILGLGDFMMSEDAAWQSLERTPELKQRYQDAKLLATGGMKEIYEVYDSKTCHKLALAQLKDGGPLWHCEVFLKEAYLTAALDHPNIISVYDIGIKDDDEPYFTMELKVGDSLTTLLNSQKADQNELLQIYLKICDAVSYAHSRSILHLDIKPDNIQVGEFGEVKLCDWGLACEFEKANVNTEMIKGTPGFMSPEQASLGVIDQQTDIYALGAILYIILAGELPFEGSSKAVISKTAAGELIFPVDRFPTKKISESLDAVVRKAMSHKKEARYHSVEELKLEVQNYLTGHSTVAEEAGFVKEFQLFYKRNRPACLVLFLSLLMIGVTTVFFFTNLRQSNKRTEESLEKLKISHNKLREAKENEKEAFRSSELNFKKYIEQKQEQLRLATELQVKDLKAAYAAVVYPNYFIDPVKAIEKSLKVLIQQQKLKPESNVEQQIIINLFISQNFEGISEYKATYTSPLLPLVETYKDIPKDEKGTVSVRDFAKLLKDINNLGDECKELKVSLLERMPHYFLAKRQTFFLHQSVIIELIKSFNLKWDSQKFHYQKKLRKLILSGKELRRLSGNAIYSNKKCVLSLLDVSDIDLRGSGIRQLYQFEGLNVGKLDVRNTGIFTVHPFSALKGISELHITKGQISEELLRIAPQSVKITID
jgi:serine/threonine protein kinase